MITIEQGTLNITLNGQAHSAAHPVRLSNLVEQLTGRQLNHDGQPADGRRLGIAVAHNSEVVPRKQWATTGINEGDDVEIVTAVQGG